MPRPLPSSPRPLSVTDGCLPPSLRVEGSSLTRGAHLVPGPEVRQAETLNSRGCREPVGHLRDDASVSASRSPILWRPPFWFGLRSGACRVMRGRSCGRRRWSPLLNGWSQFRHQLRQSLLLNRFLAPAQAIQAHDQAPTSNPKSEVRVTVDLANLRGGPGMRHAVVGQTRRGDTLQLLERRNQWLHVRLGKLDAWLHVTLAEELSVNGATVSGAPRPGAPGRRPISSRLRPPRSRAPPRRRPRSLRESNLHPWCAENGSCYGDISSYTGRSKTVHVRGYPQGWYLCPATTAVGHEGSGPQR